MKKTPSPRSSAAPRLGSLRRDSDDVKVLGATPNSTPPPIIPSKWKWHYHTLLALRARLLNEHHQHARDATAPADPAPTDLADAAQIQLERDELWRELATESDKLFEVDCALQRIVDGFYGICEETGHPIPEDRLRAVPWARYNRSAEEQHEHRIPQKPKKRTKNPAK